jgi:hypothetical protein
MFNYYFITIKHFMICLLTTSTIIKFEIIFDPMLGLTETNSNKLIIHINNYLFELLTIEI